MKFKYTVKQWKAVLSGQKVNNNVQDEIDQFIEEAYDYDLYQYLDDGEYITERKEEVKSPDFYKEAEDYCYFYTLKEGEDEERAELVARYFGDYEL